MNKKLLILILLVILILPSIAFGDWVLNITSNFGPTFSGYGSYGAYSYTTILDDILNAVWMVFTAIAVIMFVVAGINFLTANGAPEKLNTARSALIWGTAGVAVAIIAYSIIAIVSGIIK